MGEGDEVQIADAGGRVQQVRRTGVESLLEVVLPLGGRDRLPLEVALGVPGAVRTTDEVAPRALGFAGSGSISMPMPKPCAGSGCSTALKVVSPAALACASASAFSRRCSSSTRRRSASRFACTSSTGQSIASRCLAFTSSEKIQATFLIGGFALYGAASFAGALRSRRRVVRGK